MAQVKGFGARKTDEREFEKAMRREYLNRFFDRMNDRLARATAAGQAIQALDEGIKEWKAQPREGVPHERITAHVQKMEGWQRKRMIRAFRTALGVDIRPYLTHPQVQRYMREVIDESVDLIKTIPPRFHDSLKNRMEKEFLDRPFDQQRMSKVLRDEFKSTGWNLRRITRDQTGKQVAGLNRIRHEQLGITHFTWRDSRDQRVRTSCRSDNGNVYSHSSGSPIDGLRPGDRVLCFPGSVGILPAGLRRSISYRYIGPLIQMVLADGIDVTVTPNHPILTQAGWKRAAAVKKSDKLVKHTFAGSFAFGSSYPQFRNGYSLAENLHVFLGVSPAHNWTDGRSLDLHHTPARRDEKINVVEPMACCAKNSNPWPVRYSETSSSKTPTKLLLAAILLRVALSRRTFRLALLASRVSSLISSSDMDLSRRWLASLAVRRVMPMSLRHSSSVRRVTPISLDILKTDCPSCHRLWISSKCWLLGPGVNLVGLGLRPMSPRHRVTVLTEMPILAAVSLTVVPFSHSWRIAAWWGRLRLRYVAFRLSTRLDMMDPCIVLKPIPV